MFEGLAPHITSMNSSTAVLPSFMFLQPYWTPDYFLNIQDIIPF